MSLPFLKKTTMVWKRWVTRVKKSITGRAVSHFCYSEAVYSIEMSKWSKSIYGKYTENPPSWIS